MTDMLNELYVIESRLPALLADAAGWHSVLIDYHPPRVERLWRQDGALRVFLHRIHVCGDGEALFHPHPWPSAMRIVSGRYEMGVGYGPGMTPPKVAARIVMGPGTAYEMADVDSWHYVRPLTDETLSLMVTGAPWDREAPKSDHPLRPLSECQAATLLADFAHEYYWRDW